MRRRKVYRIELNFRKNYAYPIVRKSHSIGNLDKEKFGESRTQSIKLLDCNVKFRNISIQIASFYSQVISINTSEPENITLEKYQSHSTVNTPSKILKIASRLRPTVHSIRLNSIDNYSGRTRRAMIFLPCQSSATFAPACSLTNRS